MRWRQPTEASSPYGRSALIVLVEGFRSCPAGTPPVVVMVTAFPSILTSPFQRSPRETLRIVVTFRRS
jgi:hypothetical protein